MASNPVTVSLGDMAENARRHLETGEYESMSDVVREGIRVLDRGRVAYNEYVRGKVAEAHADPRPAVPLEEAMARLRAGLRPELE